VVVAVLILINSDELNRRLAPTRLIFVAIRESKWRVTNGWDFLLHIFFERVVRFTSLRVAETAEKIAIPFTLRSLRPCERLFVFGCGNASRRDCKVSVITFFSAFPATLREAIVREY